MYVPSKLTNAEWAKVEYVSKEFGHWRRTQATGKKGETYPITESELVGLLAIIARLSKNDGEWIPVSKVLPEKGQTVEIMYRKEETYKASYEPEENQFLPWRLLDYPEEGYCGSGTWRRDREKVTHWRPVQKAE